MKQLCVASPQLILNNLDLTINTHEIFGVVGTSGAGKSTLLKVLNFLIPPSSGQLLIDHQDIWKLTSKERRMKKRSIGMIFQQYHLLANRTVEENVALPLKLIGQKNPQKVQELLSFVRLEDKAKDYPKNLSGGQQQRAAIARALVTDPMFLLCDEPTSALDEKNTYDILQLLKEIHRVFQPTIVFVSHELTAVKYLCQRAAVLNNGQIEAVTEVRHAHGADDKEATLSILERLRQ